MFHTYTLAHVDPSGVIHPIGSQNLAGAQIDREAVMRLPKFALMLAFVSAALGPQTASFAQAYGLHRTKCVCTRGRVHVHHARHWTGPPETIVYVPPPTYYPYPPPVHVSPGGPPNALQWLMDQEGDAPYSQH